MFEINNATPVKIDREPFVTIDGVEYDAPVRFRAADALRFLHISQTRGIDAASAWLLGTALGDECYEKLLSAQGMTRDQLDEMVNTLIARALGKAEQAPSDGADSNTD